MTAKKNLGNVKLTIFQLEEYRKAEENAREARSRMQKELDALKALSESLSNENKSLRQEKFTLSERCEELLRKVFLNHSRFIIVGKIHHVFQLFGDHLIFSKEIQGNLLTDEVTILTSDAGSLKEMNLHMQQKVIRFPLCCKIVPAT